MNGKKKIKIYGERNTNTNYLSELINLNLKANEIKGTVPPYVIRLQHHLPGNEMVKDIYFGLTYFQNLGWKHTRIKTEEKLKKYRIVNNNLILITITKNPYSWLLSLYKRPYNQYYNSKPDFYTFLRKKWKIVGRDNITHVLNNPIELWNIKNASYLQITDINILNLTSEGLLRDPESVLKTISAKFNIEKTTSFFKNHHQSTKNKNKNFKYYQDYYLNKKWREKLSSKEINLINEYLDEKLMHKFGYEYLL